ncbi:MAG: hypothetical protein QXO78_04885 [Desulfurococcaceae archaeon]|uniref:LexA repressor DNA-binding domain-containing protein n=1 Tax=Staphylothermus marinus TaxID=2280 RepID=A0A7C4HC30_STAMA
MTDREILKYYIKLKDLNHPVGVREAQRILGFKSPGKSQRVLNKLVKLGLATRNNEGKYIISKDPPLELIGKLVIRGRVIPKVLILAIYSTTLSTTYILLAKPTLDVTLLLYLLSIPLWVASITEIIELKKRWK